MKGQLSHDGNTAVSRRQLKTNKLMWDDSIVEIKCWKKKNPNRFSMQQLNVIDYHVLLLAKAGKQFRHFHALTLR